MATLVQRPARYITTAEKDGIIRYLQACFGLAMIPGSSDSNLIVLPYGEGYWTPYFQFDPNIRPGVIRTVNGIIGARFYPWHATLWWVTRNPLLNNISPLNVARSNSNTEQLLNAAHNCSF